MIKRLLTICAATILLSACETASIDSNEVVGSSSAVSTGSDAAASASSNISDSSTSASSGASSSTSADSGMQTPDEMLAKVGSTVYFGYDQSTLTAEAQATLDRQAAFLKANPTIRIVIEGHCDERGTREYNLALGDRRAVAVRDYLLAKGLNAARVRTVSYGKERPAVSGSNEESWAKNRRAATVLN